MSAQELAGAIWDAMPLPEAGAYRGTVAAVQGDPVSLVFVTFRELGEVRCKAWAVGTMEALAGTTDRGVGRTVLVQFVDKQPYILCAITMGS